MSRQVDERVVSMQFDNKQFESNVQTSMSTLDKLQRMLKMDGATKGLEEVDRAAKKMNLGGIGTAVETVHAKFSALQIIGVTALSNIANTAVNAGKRIASALTIDPIKMGFSEYETQINAVQTILANTKSKGTTLTQVNSALDELNTYADKTIYNFTEMTRNIGTFTAAGVDLDTSVNAIQGIANLAAVSGSTSQQASTAMYQLSQALSSGTVKLMDWNSVVNAGMGGQVFQDALTETARVHGVNIDAMIKKYGSFRETLQTGWLSSEILTETLQKFTMTTEGLTEEQIEANRQMLKAKGYTDEQIKSIFELGNTATNAATKVKTFSQLWDTLKESAQSGWSQSWEIIIGDFEEAKELFTEVSDALGSLIGASAESRNKVLQGWKDLGGRTAIIDALRNAFEGIQSAIKPVSEAFREIFPPITAKQLYAFSEGLKNLSEKFKMSEATADKVKRVFKGIFAVFDLGVQAIKALFGGFKDLIGAVAPAGEGLLDYAARLGDFLVNLNKSAKSSNIFTKAIEKVKEAIVALSNFFKPVIEGVKVFARAISDSFKGIAERVQLRFEPLGLLGEAIKGIFLGVAAVVKKVAPWVSKLASNIGEVFSNLMDNISSSLQGADYNTAFDILNGGVFAAIGAFIAKFIKSGGDLLDNAGGFLENINDILGGVSDALGAFSESLKAKTLKEIAIAIGILAASLLVLSLIDSEKLTSALTAITVLFGELMGALSIFGKMSSGKEFDNIGKISRAMISMSAALLLLSVAMKIMSTMTWEEMGVGLISMVVGLGALIGAVNLLPERKVNKAAKSLKSMSAALVILAVAIRIMGGMSWKEMGVGLISMVVGLGALVGAVNLLPKDAKSRSAGMIALATAMVILGVALKNMGSMSWLEIGKGLSALAGSLVLITAALRFMPKNMMSTGAGLFAITTSLVILAKALGSMGGMSWSEIGKGLAALGGSLAIVAIGVRSMKGAIPGAIALTIVAGALAIFTPMLMLLGSMSLGEIGKGLLTLAGVFTVLGVAGLLLKPLVPTILALSGAIALFGAGVALLGVGVVAIAAGITALSVALSAGGGAIVIFVSSLIGLIPYLIKQVGIGIVELCKVIGGSADAICEAVKLIILALVDTLVACVPTVVKGAFELIIGVMEALIDYLPQIVPLLVTLLVKLVGLIVEHLPRILDAVVDLLAALITGVASRIGKLIQPVLDLLVALVKGIAGVIGPVFKTVIQPILELLKDLLVDFFEVIAPYIPDICDLFRELTTIVCNAITRITEVLAPYIPDIVSAVETISEAFTTLIQEISPIVDSVAGLVDTIGTKLAEILYAINDTIGSVGTLIKDALTGIADVIGSIGGAIKESLDGFAGVFDSAFSGVAKVIDSVGDGIKKFLDGIAGVIDSVGEAALNCGTGFEKLANGVSKIVKLNLADLAASMKAVADGMAEIAKHGDGMSEAGSGMKNISDGLCGSASSVKTITKSISDALRSFSSLPSAVNISTAGVKNALDLMVKNLGYVATEVTTKTYYIMSAMSSMGSSCTTIINGFASNIATAGTHMISGLANGIRAGKANAVAAAYEVASAVESIIRSAWEVNSPSKLFYGIALGVGEGVQYAFEDSMSGVSKSADELANSAIDGFSDVVRMIAETIDSDIDSEPTIKPVFDLTDLKSGASTINGMLNGKRVLSINPSGVGAISASMSKFQNGNNSYELLSTLRGLRKDMTDNPRNSYSIGGISISADSDVANAIETLVRAIKVEGRT